METKSTKSVIFNLIVLDESGSMDCLKNQTIAGCNETINTIKAAQKKFSNTQQHFVSIYVFQDGEQPSRYLIKNADANEVKHIDNHDYMPWGMTNLNDAVGMTLADLKATCKTHANAIGNVTIITDGMENASTDYTTSQVAHMIWQLKELGWSFNFIGANIDVKATSAQYNIDNALEFKQDEAGTNEMFFKERSSRMSYYERVEHAHSMCHTSSEESRKEMLKQAASNYFNQQPRVAPNHIAKLSGNEIFVFGSNLQGMHSGGAARIAVTKFGAVMGQGVGLQGQCYAIPTMQGGTSTIAPYVDEFIEFAKTHTELKFLVTRIGCGIAGFTDSHIAPLFKEALHVENIYLPQSFIDELAK